MAAYGKALPADAFPFVRRLVQERTAIRLDERAEQRLEARLQPIAQHWRLPSVPALVEKLQEDPDEPALADAVVDAMTTTETAFFRDFGVFEYLRVVAIPQLVEACREEQRMAIWCAACSSGQEPYSAAMLLHDEFPEVLDWDLNILACDVSQRQLDRARDGAYSQVEVNRGLPARYLARHFQADGDHFKLNDRIRSMVNFERINLVAEWPGAIPWDLIFLRNVLIYFDAGIRTQLQERLAAAMAPQSLLVVGRGEMPLMDAARFEALDAQSPIYTLHTDTDEHRADT